MLNETQVLDALNKLNTNSNLDEKWAIKDEKLVNTFKFSNFVHAFSWMTQVAFYAEKLNHHPEWENIYNKVQVKLITHDKNSITHLDFELAEKMQTSFIN
jgi:4a-hydroxytetrahydrobiopterin dehydratase